MGIFHLTVHTITICLLPARLKLKHSFLQSSSGPLQAFVPLHLCLDRGTCHHDTPEPSIAFKGCYDRQSYSRGDQRPVDLQRWSSTPEDDGVRSRLYLMALLVRHARCWYGQTQ